MDKNIFTCGKIGDGITDPTTKLEIFDPSMEKLEIKEGNEYEIFKTYEPDILEIKEVDQIGIEV